MSTLSLRRNFAASTLVIAAVLLAATSAYAQDKSLNQDAKKAGTTVGSAVHTIGKDGEKVGLTIGHAAKAGGLAFWHAIKGDKH